MSEAKWGKAPNSATIPDHEHQGYEGGLCRFSWTMSDGQTGFCGCPSWEHKGFVREPETAMPPHPPRHILDGHGYHAERDVKAYIEAAESIIRKQAERIAELEAQCAEKA